MRKKKVAFQNSHLFFEHPSGTGVSCKKSRGSTLEMDKIKIIQFCQGEILLFPMESHILSICNRILYGMKMGGRHGT